MSTSLSPQLPQPGELILGKYEVTAAIGGNTHEIVYEARETLTQRQVALRLSLSSTDSELEASSRFRHPSVFETLEVGKVHGAPCAVLDWCLGESLETRLGRLGPQPMAELARLLAPCIRGVMAAHVAGIVHHVIKPSTIYLCLPESGRPEQVKLLPFELDARRAQQLMAARRRGTEPNAHRLPESRAALLADPRADVRAFGAIVYLALTGQRPAQQAASTPSLRPIERWFIERSLSESCDRPFQTLAELVTALENMSSTMPRAAVDRHAAGESQGVPGRDDTPARRRKGPITARQRRIPRQAPVSPTPAAAPEPQLPPSSTDTPERSPPRALPPAASSDADSGEVRTAPASLALSPEHPLVWVPTRPQLGRGAGAQLATRHAFAQLPTQPLPRIRKLPELDRTLELSPSVPTLASIARSAHGIAEQLFGLGRPQQQTRLLAGLAGALVVIAFIFSLIPDRRRAPLADAPLADNRALPHAAATMLDASAPPYVAAVERPEPYLPPPAAARALPPPKLEPVRAASRRATRVRTAAPAQRVGRALPNVARDKRGGPKPSAPARAPVQPPPKPAPKQGSGEALDQMGLL